MSHSELPERTARRDCLVLLEAARGAGIAVTPSEVHAMCYFARVLSCSTLSGFGEPLPYEFTFGKSGGPYSSVLNECLDELEQMGLLSFSSRAPHRALIELRQDDLLDTLISVDREFDLEDNDEHLTALIDAVQLRSVSRVVGTILREPSLVEARRSGLRDGMPLPELLRQFRRWLAELRLAMAQRLGRAIAPNLFVPLVLDILDPVNEVRLESSAG